MNLNQKLYLIIIINLNAVFPFQVLFCLYIFGTTSNAFFLGGGAPRTGGHYGPPKPHYSKPSYPPPAKPSYKPPTKPTYESTAVEINEIDDGYGSPAAPVISTTYITKYYILCFILN